jgi:uncharacterized protein
MDRRRGVAIAMTRMAAACGAVDFGDAARNFVDEYQLAWLAAWTKGRREALDALPRVRVFVTGSNSWHDADRWPLPGTTAQTWYLRSAGRANLSGNGALSLDKPSASRRGPRTSP